MNKPGVILPTLLFIMLVLSVITLSLATFATNQIAAANLNISATNALLSAEAGAEQSLYALNQDNTFNGYSVEQEFFNNETQGRATYQTVIDPGSVSNEKVITATGRVYSTKGSLQSERQVRLIVVGTTAVDYSVQTGPGGLIMTNSATIANGDVHVNGYLTMSNSARIGSSSNPTRVWVAHFNCPSGGSSYPSQCTSGNPITITHSARIYAEVYATNQTDGSGMSHSGLVAGSTAPVVSLPEYDRETQTAAVANTLSSSVASCNGNQTRSFEPNTKIEGDLTISNNCQVTVKGNLWISGNLTLSNQGAIKVAGTAVEAPGVIVDGSNGIKLSNNSAVVSNANGLGFRFVTYYSTLSCSTAASNACEVTGNDLYGSRDIITINISNSSLAAGSTFYARWSKVNLNNGGSIGGVIGQTVQLSNAGNISFGTELSSGDSVWTIKNYQQIYE